MSGSGGGGGGGGSAAIRLSRDAPPCQARRQKLPGGTRLLAPRHLGCGDRPAARHGAHSVVTARRNNNLVAESPAAGALGNGAPGLKAVRRTAVKRTGIRETWRQQKGEEGLLMWDSFSLRR